MQRNLGMDAHDFVSCHSIDSETLISKSECSHSHGKFHSVKNDTNEDLSERVQSNPNVSEESNLVEKADGLTKPFITSSSVNKCVSQNNLQSVLSKDLHTELTKSIPRDKDMQFSELHNLHSKESEPSLSKCLSEDRQSDSHSLSVLEGGSVNRDRNISGLLPIVCLKRLKTSATAPQLEVEEDDSAAGNSICEVSSGQEERLSETNDRSDGSDSGLGSDLAEDRNVVITQVDSFSLVSAHESNGVARKSEAGKGSASQAFFLDRIPDELGVPSKTLESQPKEAEVPVRILRSTPNADESAFAALENGKGPPISVPLTMGLRYTTPIASTQPPIEEPDIGAILEAAQAPPRSRRSSLKRHHEYDEGEASRAKKKKSISFDNVTVYYFPRSQGFTCVPSQGGSTLGMTAQHAHVQQFSLPEHAVEQRRLHRQVLLQLRNERLSAQRAVASSSDESESDDDQSDASESELDLDNYYFLQLQVGRIMTGAFLAAAVWRRRGQREDCYFRHEQTG